MGKQEYKVIRPYSDAEKKAFEDQYGERNIVEFSVKTDDGYDFQYLVKRPSKPVVQAITEIEKKPENKKLARDVTDQQNLMEGCVIAGDKQALIDDAAIYNALLAKIGGLVNKAKADLKKVVEGFWLDPEDDTQKEFEKIDAILRVELGLNPKELSDEEWAQQYQEWIYVQRLKIKATELSIEKVVRKALADTLKAINGK